MAKSDKKQDLTDSKWSDTSSNDTNTAALQLEQPTLSGGELGTLQEILFGKQMASHSKQILSLHNHVEDQLSKLQKSCDQQFAELHRKLDESLRGVSSQLEQNDKKQATGLTETNDKLTAAELKLMTQLSQANDQLTKSMQSSRDDIMQRLESAIAELDTQKLDKGALSSLLGDVATQLTGQAKT